jgi:hypothetical protein
MRRLAGLQCCRSRLRQDCSPVLVQVRWLRNSRPSGTQTCSPSPCLQQGANLTLPVRLRRQQGAHPGTASALVTPLVARIDPAAAACRRLSNHHREGRHNLPRWHATTLRPWHAASGAKKGWAGIWPGALLVLEERSKEVGTRSVLRELTRRSCLSVVAVRPRSEFSVATSVRAPQGSPATRDHQQ